MRFLWLTASFCFAVAAHAQETPDVKSRATEEFDESSIPPLIPTSAFADRFDLGGVELSPDGKRFAYTRVEDGSNFLYVVNADTRQALQKIPMGTETEFNWFRWASNDRILYSLGGVLKQGSREAAFTRLFLYDLIGAEKRYIGFPKQSFVGDDVIYTDPAGEFILLDVSQSIYKWPDVWRFPLDGSGHENAVKLRAGRDPVNNWVADSQGVVRMGYGPLRSGRTFVTYRGGPDKKWKRVALLKRGSDESEKWNVFGIQPGSDLGFSLTKNDGEEEALYEFNYLTGEPTRLIYRQPGYPIDSVGLDKKSRPISVHYTDDASQIHWLDQTMASYQSMLEKALPKGRVRMISRSDGGRRMLVWNGSESDPGALYVFTPGEKKLDLFANYRPSIDFRMLSQPKPFDYVARDGTKIRAYLTLPKNRDPKGLPLIILPHGGPFGVRDMLSYSDRVQFLANRGYAVIQPNFRGSGGYGEAFEKLGEGQIGKAMQDDLDDAMDWAVEKGYVDADRVCVIGGSYGGFAALWAVIRNPERYRCAASWAGVTDWKKQLRYDRNYLGRRLYSDFKDQIEGEDDFDMDSLSPARMVENLSRPVLLAHGKKDKRVPFDQFEFMVERAEKAGKTIATLEVDDGHSFTTKKTEQQWFDALDGFLAKHNPAN